MREWQETAGLAENDELSQDRPLTHDPVRASPLRDIADELHAVTDDFIELSQLKARNASRMVCRSTARLLLGLGLFLVTLISATLCLSVISVAYLAEDRSSFAMLRMAAMILGMAGGIFALLAMLLLHFPNQTKSSKDGVIADECPHEDKEVLD